MSDDGTRRSTSGSAVAMSAPATVEYHYAYPEDAGSYDTFTQIGAHADWAHEPNTPSMATLATAIRQLHRQQPADPRRQPVHLRQQRAAIWSNVGRGGTPNDAPVCHWHRRHYCQPTHRHRDALLASWWARNGTAVQLERAIRHSARVTASTATGRPDQPSPRLRRRARVDARHRRSGALRRPRPTSASGSRSVRRRTHSRRTASRMNPDDCKCAAPVPHPRARQPDGQRRPHHNAGAISYDNTDSGLASTSQDGHRRGGRPSTAP